MVTNPERKFAMQFQADSFSSWLPGRLFRVADEKGGMTYLPLPGRKVTLAEGDTLTYRGICMVPSIVGDEDVEMIFTKYRNPQDTVVYRPGMSTDEMRSQASMNLPFLVDLIQVAKVGDILTGMELYTRTNRWFGGNGNESLGRKFLKVRIDVVAPGNEIYPYLISFHSAEDGGEKGSMLMAPTVADGVPSLRGFENIFLLENPRPNYPNISDYRWELIRRGKVETGMTTQEVQLALGSPSEVDKRPDQSVLYERWGYPGGIYLIFEDGLLANTNL